MNDFIKQQELIQSKLKGTSALIGVSDKDIQLALIEIKEIGKEEGAKQKLEELESFIYESKTQGISHNSLLLLIDDWLEQKIKELSEWSGSCVQIAVFTANSMKRMNANNVEQ